MGFSVINQTLPGEVHAPGAMSTAVHCITAENSKKVGWPTPRQRAVDSSTGQKSVNWIHKYQHGRISKTDTHMKKATCSKIYTIPPEI